MKNLTLAFFLFFGGLLFAQNVYLNKVEKTNDNQDKFLYLISEDANHAEYLAELEVQGFSNDDASVFSQIYKKAKEIGANAYTVKPIESIDGATKKFDISNYKLLLYYIVPEKISPPKGDLYLFASSSKDQKISVNKKDYLVAPRTYLRLPMTTGEIYTISTKKLLGSSIKIQKNAKNDDQYYQISSARLGNSSQNDGTIHLKSGDIVGVEKSFAQFLRVIYQQGK